MEIYLIPVSVLGPGSSAHGISPVALGSQTAARVLGASSYHAPVGNLARMPDSPVPQLHAWLASHEGELLDNYRALLRFPSIESDPEPNAPFGKANRDALDFMLGLARDSGMRTTDLEGYAGYAEFGDGPKMVATLGHLDVVPVGPGWKHDPFGAEIDDGYVYSRGAVDDKGPTMAAFYASRALQECMPNVTVRFRNIFGCDEESGFECVKRYMETEEPPTFGVAPDAYYPLVHAEKGIANLFIERPLPRGDLALLEITGGQRPNIVIDHCTARASVAPGAMAEVKAALEDAWDRNVTWTWQGSELLIEGVGKAAHGSYPIGGDNAAARVLRFLKEISPLSKREDYTGLLECCELGGAFLGIGGSDEVSGSLSANLGIIETRSHRVRLTVNVRYPVTWKGADLRARCEQELARKPGEYVLAEFSDSPSLYFPLEHPMVQAICEAVRIETGEDKAPGVMGGGTYARAVPNTVAIGTGWPGDGDAHETDERLKVEHLFKMSRVYAHVFYRLVELAR